MSDTPELNEVEGKEEKKRSIVSTSLWLLPAQIVFRAGEAFLPLLLAAWFGRSKETDIYYFTWAVFAFAGALIFTAFQDSALVPIYAEVKRDDKEGLPKFLGSLLTHTWIYGGALAATIGVLSVGYFRLRYGSDSGAFLLAAKMVPPFSVLLVAMATRTFLTCLLNAEHKYFVAPVASSFSVVTTLTLIFVLRHKFGVLAIPASSLAGECVAILVLLGVARRSLGLRFAFSLTRTEPMLRWATLVAWEVGGNAVSRVNPVVDQLMAGIAAVVGGGTLLRYTMDIASLPTSLLSGSLLTVLLSHLSEFFAAGKTVQIRRTVLRSTLAVVLLMTGICLLIWMVRVHLFRFVFLRGEMDAQGVERMISILPYHLVGMPGFGVLLLLSRAHIALLNSRIMFGMGLLNAGVNVVLNLVLVRFIGLEGIALSTSIVNTVVAIVFYIRLEARLKEVGVASTQMVSS